MSRQEAAEQYLVALKAGQKCRKECLIQGKYPYPQVLDEIFDESMAAGRVELGTINIPTEHIVGTKTGGRQNAFAANFMPLLGDGTEFAHKWISLCEANLSDEGIRDPIRCCEYMGRFYVQEGNKRVSVLKSFGAPSIPAVVTRIIPAWSQEREVRLYYEFMRFYQLSRLYILSFSRLGSYVKLQAALGFDADHVWSEAERRSFSAAYYAFRTALEKCEGSRFPETIGDALLIFLQVFSFGELKAMTQTELERSIAGIWPEVEVQARPAPIAVNTESSVETKGVWTKLVDSIRLPSHLNVAFVNELPPEKSAWIMSHDRGREYLERHMPDKVTTKVYNADTGHDADSLLDAAAADGAQVIFATTPRLISACRKAAVKHPNIKILNCSISMPFPGVRTYYSRVYEGKFISGAVAGAMTKTGRIGYIASSPIYGVPAGINAFALGALLTNPDIKICLRWSSVSEDPIGELKDLGVDMISNRDVPSPEQPQDAWGLCRVDGSGALIPIGSPFWNWGEMYVHIIENILGGGWDELSAVAAVNYWWGFASGAVDVQLMESLPDGPRELVRLLRAALTHGELAPFHRRIADQTGAVQNDGERWLAPEEVLHMDWLCANVRGSIPQYDELLPMARPMVRLLGLYRETLQPEKRGPLL